MAAMPTAPRVSSPNWPYMQKPPPVVAPLRRPGGRVGRAREGTGAATTLPPARDASSALAVPQPPQHPLPPSGSSASSFSDGSGPHTPTARRPSASTIVPGTARARATTRASVIRAGTPSIAASARAPPTAPLTATANPTAPASAGLVGPGPSAPSWRALHLTTQPFMDEVEAWRQLSWGTYLTAPCEEPGGQADGKVPLFHLTFSTLRGRCAKEKIGKVRFF